jgi:hypothetical protein
MTEQSVVKQVACMGGIPPVGILFLGKASLNGPIEQTEAKVTV